MQLRVKDKIDFKSKSYYTVEDYEKLISLIVGSLYVTFTKNDTVPNFYQDIAKTRKSIGKGSLQKKKIAYFETMSQRRGGGGQAKPN